MEMTSASARLPGSLSFLASSSPPRSRTIFLIFSAFPFIVTTSVSKSTRLVEVHHLIIPTWCPRTSPPLDAGAVDSSISSTFSGVVKNTRKVILISR